MKARVSGMARLELYMRCACAKPWFVNYYGLSAYTSLVDSLLLLVGTIPRA
uniref:Uncharacterized protein n=1 Tax=Arundo donax TaxID=35708 RepID=A0A0A9ATL3_ARUDO